MCSRLRLEKKHASPLCCLRTPGCSIPDRAGPCWCTHLSFRDDTNGFKRRLGETPILEPAQVHLSPEQRASCLPVPSWLVKEEREDRSAGSGCSGFLRPGSWPLLASARSWETSGRLSSLVGSASSTRRVWKDSVKEKHLQDRRGEPNINCKQHAWSKDGRRVNEQDIIFGGRVSASLAEFGL